MRRFFAMGLSVLLIGGLLGASAMAQGLLVVTNASDPVPLPRPAVRPGPVPPMAYKIKELTVNARVVDQIARVQVSQTFVNTGSRQMEVSLLFPLPYDGAIERMTFLVDGKEFPAKLLPAAEARKIYEGYVRRNQDPALLEWMGTGMFQTSVFPVPPGAERTVLLHYSQVLRKDQNLTDLLFPLGTAKYTSSPLEKLEIKTSIESSIEIKTVYSPTHSIDIKRPDAHHAVVHYLAKNEVPTGDFRVFYGVDKGKIGAGVISYRPESGEEGYFLLLASPQIKKDDDQPVPKTIVCVFDRSGSMSGAKIDQARAALKSVLNNLRKGDLFNIVAYDSDVETFKPELERFNDTTRAEAIGFVEGLSAGGGTNIDAALATALDMLKDSSRPSYVIFMTDGQPTMGETDEMKIVQRSQAKNRVRARMISLGVGYDVNCRLLDRLSRAHFGKSEFVRPNEDIEEMVARVYNKIHSPVMTDVTVKFEFDSLKTEEGPPIRRVYPKELTDLFAGEQLAMVGRYAKTGAAKVRIRGKVGDDAQEFDFPVELTSKSTDQKYAFIEKLWAMRRIGEIIDEMDLHGKNEELIKELVALSTKHGVLTPYTSFLADETAPVGDLARGNAKAPEKTREMLRRLDETDGVAGLSQREMKKNLLEAQLAPQQKMAGDMKMRDIGQDKDRSVGAVQMVDNQVLYKRGNVWYTFDVAKQDAKEVAAKATEVKRFSKPYFELLKKSSPAASKALSRQAPGEEMMLEMDGKVYRVK
ncbi:MAG: VWA domain-containing protein [Pirellulales bacterium]|nr:VWA domain-containing protein [Pirellulales bacterium]